jgi:hypothetical protein
MQNCPPSGRGHPHFEHIKPSIFGKFSLQPLQILSFDKGGKSFPQEEQVIGKTRDKIFKKKFFI